MHLRSMNVHIVHGRNEQTIAEVHDFSVSSIQI